MKKSVLSSVLKKIDLKHGAQNYKPLNVILKKGKGVYVKDINNKQYIDFLSSYSSVNQGHCHPRLVKTMQEQCNKLTLCSRAFYSENLILFYKYMHETFKYDKCLPMNTGVEAGETAIKLARLWGYKKKNINENEAIVLMANNNFWGRTITACSSSTDPSCYTNFGPYTPGFDFVEFNNMQHLRNKLENNPNICAFMVEPIQGEAGIILPSNNYLQQVSELCKRHNVLLICDEVQTGIGRTGKMLASELYNIKPDMLLLGKALSGGMMPISAVLANNNIMDLIQPGTHGSTYGGNPLATKIAIDAIDIIISEKLTDNARRMGQHFRNSLKPYVNTHIKDIRGIGLFNAIEFFNNKEAELFVDKCLHDGLLTKITHNNTVRMCPPLTINKSQMNESLNIIANNI